MKKLVYFSPLKEQLKVNSRGAQKNLREGIRKTVLICYLVCYFVKYAIVVYTEETLVIQLK